MESQLVKALREPVYQPSAYTNRTLSILPAHGNDGVSGSGEDASSQS